jgi:hypothetical protein
MKLKMKILKQKDTENGKQASGLNITKPPDDPRCKVCFKQVTSTVFCKLVAFVYLKGLSWTVFHSLKNNNLLTVHFYYLLLDNALILYKWFLNLFFNDYSAQIAISICSPYSNIVFRFLSYSLLPCI